MKLKAFTIGLLATIAMANQAEAMMKRTYEAPKIEEKLKQHEDLQAKVEPMLDVATHGNQEAAARHVNTTIGKHPAQASRTGTTVNHKIADVNTRLGKKTVGSAGDTTHHRVTDIMSIQGAVTNGAVNRGNGSGNVGANANDLAGTAIKNEEAILARLKAGLAHNIGAGVAVQGTVATKANGTAAGPITHGGPGRDAEAAAAATNVQDFLAEIGW
jgi:hypothetical protein